MVHRALFGSVERFFGILLEHYAGAFPVWLSPVQAQVLPVRDDHEAYASEVDARLQAEGLRADTSEADEPLGGRIRQAKMEKIPYVLVVGDSDVAGGTAGVNPREGGVERDVPVEEFVARCSPRSALTVRSAKVTLERLWAGWRMSTSRESATPGPGAGPCVFCRIFASELPPEATFVVSPRRHWPPSSTPSRTRGAT